MKLIDRNGRLFGKLSVVDLLVAAVVLVLAVALNFKGGQTHTGASVTQQTFTYQILARGMRSYAAGAVCVGDKLFDHDQASGGTLGRITAVETFPGTKLGEQLDDGTFDFLPAEDSVDLLITVEGEGILSDGHYLLNRVYHLGVNSSRTYCTPYVQFIGTVAAIL